MDHKHAAASNTVSTAGRIFKMHKVKMPESRHVIKMYKEMIPCYRKFLLCTFKTIGIISADGF